MRAWGALVVVIIAVLTGAVAAVTPSRSSVLPVATAGGQIREQTPATPTTTPALFAADKLLAGLVRTDTASDSVSVAAAWLTPEYLQLEPAAGLYFDPQRYLLFRIAVYSPSSRMSVWDLKGMIYLRDESGKEYGTPIWMPTDSGPLWAGLAAFPAKDSRGNSVPAAGSRWIEIVIRDLHGVKERVFRWQLDR